MKRKNGEQKRFRRRRRRRRRRKRRMLRVMGLKGDGTLKIALNFFFFFFFFFCGISFHFCCREVTVLEYNTVVGEFELQPR